MRRTRGTWSSVRARLPVARLADEGGYVIVVVMAMLAIGLAMGAVALAESLDTKSHANRDTRVKRALQAADAGVQAVLYQQNALDLRSLEFNGGPLGLASLLDCVVPAFDVNLKITGLVTTSVNSAGVCPATSGTGGGGAGFTGVPVGDHAFYQALFIPGASSPGVAGGSVGHRILTPKIVSAGWDDNGNASDTAHYTTRRVEAILAPVDPFQAVEAQGNLTFQGPRTYVLGNPVGVLPATLNGNARAGGSVTTPTVFLNTDLNGSVIGSVGYGTTFTGPLIALSHVYHTVPPPPSRAPVSISAAKPSCPSADPIIPRQGGCIDLGSAYNSATDSVSLPSGGSITFPPGDYVFCNFDVENGSVNANANAAAPVRIFIDGRSTSRCAGHGQAGDFIAKNGIGNALSNLANATGASYLQIYVVGDQNSSNLYDDATKVTIGATPLLLGAGVIQSYVVYAPTSLVNINNCTAVLVLGTGNDVCGAIQGSVIGNDVTVKSLLYSQDLDLSNYPLYSGLGAFHVQRYVECPPRYPLPTPDPTSGC